MVDASSQEMLKNLKEEVKCPLCLDTFTKPKMLPCQHVFCLQCLQAIILRGAKESFNCPLCLRETPIQGFDADQFPTAIQANRFIDMYQKALGQSASQFPKLACSQHTSQSLALFCQTCKKLVCRDCVISSCSKKGHDYDFLEAVSKKYRVKLKQMMKPVHELHEKMSSILGECRSDGKVMKCQLDDNIHKVNERFGLLLDILESERKFIISVIEERYREHSFKEKKLEAAVDELSGLLSSVCDDSKLSMEEVPELYSKHHKIKVLLEKFSSMSLHSELAPDLKVEMISQLDFKDLLVQRNYILEAEISLDDDVLKSVQVNKEFSMAFTIPHCRETFELNAALVSTRDKSSQPFAITREKDKFKLQVVPKKRGRHTLHVLHNETYFYNSPFPVFVNTDPSKDLDTAMPFREPFPNSIIALKCFDDHIYINEAHKIIVCAKVTENPTSLQIVRKIPAPDVREFTIHDDKVLITTTKDYVITLDMNGCILNSAGGRGFLPGLFHFANSLKVSALNEVYICDTKNNRIQVFNLEMTYLRGIGRKGNGPGEFNAPDDLDFDEDGNLYIVEELNHRIQVLSPQGAYIRFIGGGLGNGLGQLQRPISLVVYRKLIYVTDSLNSRISVFDVDGSHVTSFRGGLSHPEGIAVDEDGFIYVTSNCSLLTRF